MQAISQSGTLTPLASHSTHAATPYDPMGQSPGRNAFTDPHSTPIHLLSSPPYSPLLHTRPLHETSTPVPILQATPAIHTSTPLNHILPLLSSSLSFSNQLSSPLLHSSQTLLSISADWAHSLHPNTQTYAPSRRLTLSIL
eukprot:Blabericola_migrator_1__544@NODE_1133_length_5329_cov_658_167807_g752_i2_p4_GENE_NODE_1133_length_5329_cov_658_167807_g752_i2NODE_1133_length_5329_cov_658_167807_g752_i2_p4_ORF_typecomplete_len141_score13_00Peptidase_M18/PF02127_15/0_22_NODE_1133_length_5329_cov_658_167807_g752_i226963118